MIGKQIVDDAHQGSARCHVWPLLVLCTAVGGWVGGCRSLSGVQEPAKPAATAPKDQESFRWPEGKRAAVSLTFDDARVSQVEQGVPILDAYGVKATFYVSPSGVERRLAAWKEAAANGHEMGNHTLRHPCSGNFTWSRHKALEDYTLEQMGRELDEASSAIERLLGVRATTFAYTCGQTFVGRGVNTRSYVPVVAERFIVGRGAYDEAANDPAYCDLAQATGIELDGLDFEQARRLIERAAEEGRWLIFFGHDVGEPGRQTVTAATLEALCRYGNDPANRIWIDTVDAIGTYIVKQRAESHASARMAGP